MDDNELLKKDLIFILCASEKFDLSKDEYVKKLNLLLKRRSDVNTILGKTYRERLIDIEEGKIAENCFICNKNRAADRVICSSCMKKYSGGKKHIFSENVSTVEANTVEDSSVETNATETSSVETNATETSSVETSTIETSTVKEPTPTAPVTTFTTNREKEKSIEDIKTATVEFEKSSEESVLKDTTITGEDKPATVEAKTITAEDTVVTVEDATATTENTTATAENLTSTAEDATATAEGKLATVETITVATEDATTASEDTAVTAQAKPKNKSKGFSFFGKELSRRYKVIIAILAVLILISGVAGAKGRNINVNGVPVSNGETYVTAEGLELSYYEEPTGKVSSEEAARILRDIFPKSDGFQVDYARDGRTFQFWFWGPLGRTTDLSELIVEESNDADLRNMAYSVENVYYFSIKSDKYDGIAIVNSDGRVVAQGSLPGFPDYTNIFRIR